MERPRDSETADGFNSRQIGAASFALALCAISFLPAFWALKASLANAPVPIPQTTPFSPAAIFLRQGLAGFLGLKTATFASLAAALCLHGLNTLLFFRLTDTLFGKSRLANFIGAIIFALHPLNIFPSFFAFNLGKLAAFALALAAILVFLSTGSLARGLILAVSGMLFDISAAIALPALFLPLKSRKWPAVALLSAAALLTIQSLRIIFWPDSLAAQAYYPSLKEFISGFLLKTAQLPQLFLFPFESPLVSPGHKAAQIAFGLSAVAVTGYFLTITAKRRPQAVPFLAGWLVFSAAVKTSNADFLSGSGYLLQNIEFNGYGTNIALIWLLCETLKSLGRGIIPFSQRYAAASIALGLTALCAPFLAQPQARLAFNEYALAAKTAAAYPSRASLNGQARYYIEKQNYYEAYAALDKAKRITASRRLEAETSFYAGTVYLNGGFYRHAEAEFIDALAKNPADCLALSGLAQAYLKNSKAAAAEITINKALVICPKSAGLRYQKALILLNARRFPQALDEFRSACGLDRRYCQHLFAI